MDKLGGMKTNDIEVVKYTEMLKGLIYIPDYVLICITSVRMIKKIAIRESAVGCQRKKGLLLHISCYDSHYLKQFIRQLLRVNFAINRIGPWLPTSEYLCNVSSSKLHRNAYGKI